MQLNLQNSQFSQDKEDKNSQKIFLHQNLHVPINTLNQRSPPSADSP
jgi:hypothetical protein